MKKSFAFAFKGISYCIRTERNFRFHMAFAFYVLIAGAVTGLTKTEWFIVLVCIGTVTAAELFNTAIETLCDTLHPSKDTGIGRAKDLAAAGVLMLAISSAVIGAIIFFNAGKISEMTAFVSSHIALAALIAGTVPLNAYFVFRSNDNDKKDRYDHNRRTSERR